MPRFPTRTLVLMVLALGAFVWMYWKTHRPLEPVPLTIDVVPAGGGAPR